ncbi:MAG TPA: hypothetical protein VGN84_05950 [Solirubrobacterales bacterium]|jgi:uncharacterized delta-60 repeat protein|nr:hypothetical protein [Solirubrobacterales bacterium]
MVLYGIGDLATAPARRLTRTLGGCYLALALAAGLVSTAGAAPGYPDPSFGRRGVVKLDLDRASDIVAADIAGDRRRGFAVVTRSADDRSFLIRLTPAGSLDSSFGDSGSVSLPGGPWNAVDMAADGTIVIAGSENNDLAVARFIPDGHPDPSFGSGGTTIVHALALPPSSSYFRDFDDPREAFADAEVEPDGSLLAVGNLRLYKKRVGEEEEHSYLDSGTVAARFRADGSLDPSFGEGGTTDPTVASGGRLKEVNRLTQQPDGKILLAGNMTSNLAVARLTAAGVLDPGFGRGGIVVSNADTFNSGEGSGQIGDAKVVLVRPDGRLVVVGRTTLLGLLPNGSRDQSFGAHGRAFTEDLYGNGINASSGALDDKGRILLAGDISRSSAVGRFLPDGRRDRRFGGDGLAQTGVTHGSSREHETDESATAILALADGATVTAGFAFAGKHGELAVVVRSGGDGHMAYCHGKVATVQGTPGPDRIHSYGAIVAMGGDDVIRNSGGPICAGAGDDVIYNQHGDIYAGAGDDQVREDWGGVIHGGSGDDVLEAHGEGVDVLYGDAGADRLVGEGGRDRLFGGAGDDALLGGGGADSLLGGPGDDLLLGGSGADRLLGGPGSNRLLGGPAGPAKTIYQMRRRGFQIRLRVEGNLIAGIHLSVRLHCRDGSQEGTEFDSNHVNLRIHPNGSFREQDSNNYEVGYEESLLAGKVRNDRITGVYRELDSEQTTCTTGEPGKPLIHFTARSIGRTQ